MKVTDVRDVPFGEWSATVLAVRAEGFTFFDWLSAVDQTDAETDAGFDLVCHLIDVGAPGEGRGLRSVLLRTRAADGVAVPSLTAVFAGAAWHERETHEMFGIGFDGFDDGTGLGLRPLLLPDGFEGTPLRKSFMLAARASKPWPGAKEPGEGHESTKAPGRRRVQAPGVPSPEWGPR
ncbi:MAG: NADH-quinone oxidoreductase subunit C [Humibacillus sp.]|nr:NADH-quinone oxidoreductase subunit C [Humibacillus sp.]MDN5776085.1 NADH-quinone oxidoreductase subunit C [Humibacillus sp.]